MKRFFQKFNIRWSDIDANRHLSNSAYMNFCSQTRLAYLKHHRISLSHLIKWNVGPVILEEKFSYYKEFYADQEVFVGIEVKGKSEDGNIFKIQHKIYNKEGVHHATSEVIGVWIDMILRKRVAPPEEIALAFEHLVNDPLKIENITIEDIKKNSIKPENIDSKELFI